MMHFFFVFAILFLMLAFMANFLLGGRIHIFGTFGEACSAQVRMLFGEFIYADGVEVLSGTSLIMYWLYAISFMLLGYERQVKASTKGLLEDSFICIHRNLGISNEQPFMQQPCEQQSF